MIHAPLKMRRVGQTVSLIDQSQRLRRLHYSYRTPCTYCHMQRYDRDCGPNRVATFQFRELPSQSCPRRYKRRAKYTYTYSTPNKLESIPKWCELCQAGFYQNETDFSGDTCLAFGQKRNGTFGNVTGKVMHLANMHSVRVGVQSHGPC